MGKSLSFDDDEPADDFKKMILAKVTIAMDLIVKDRCLSEYMPWDLQEMTSSTNQSERSQRRKSWRKS